MERVIFGLAVFPKDIKCSAVEYQKVIVPTGKKSTPTFWVLNDDRGMMVEINTVSARDLLNARAKVLYQVGAVFDEAIKIYSQPVKKSVPQRIIDWLLRWRKK